MSGLAWPAPRTGTSRTTAELVVPVATESTGYFFDFVVCSSYATRQLGCSFLRYSVHVLWRACYWDAAYATSNLFVFPFYLIFIVVISVSVFVLFRLVSSFQDRNGRFFGDQDLMTVFLSKRRFSPITFSSRSNYQFRLDTTTTTNATTTIFHLTVSTTKPRAGNSISRERRSNVTSISNLTSSNFSFSRFFRAFGGFFRIILSMQIVRILPPYSRHTARPVSNMRTKEQREQLWARTTLPSVSNPGRKQCDRAIPQQG